MPATPPDGRQRWKIGQAKQRFSEVVRRAAVEPQIICNRERVVAAVIDAGSADRLQSIVEGEGRQTIAEAFDAFREMAARERYRLRIPPRKTGETHCRTASPPIPSRPTSSVSWHGRGPTPGWRPGPARWRECRSA